MPRGPRRRLGGHELVEQLNAAVAQLIKENRKLKRQVEKLTAKIPKRATGTVDRSLRTIQKRVQKALTAPARKRRRRSLVATAKKRITRKA
jgi:cell division septum initiation protein DivIVA